MSNLRPDNPLIFAIEQKTPAEFMRLPPPGEKDPIFGLTRSYLNMLILPCRENEYRPPVKSFVLKRARTKKGVRLIEIASLRNYIYAQIREQEAEAAAPAKRQEHRDEQNSPPSI